MKIAAVIITKNEETNIVRCLKSVLFCNERIVVDSGSVDRTEEFARQYATLFVRHDWLGYADQKNFANSLAEADWILSIDADEEVSQSLQQEIRKKLSSPSVPNAFSMKRKTLYAGRWIRHGGWYPNRVVRLFNKRHGSWRRRTVHEYWDADGVVEELENDLVHHSFNGISDQVDRNNRYSTLGTLELAKENSNFSLYYLVTKPLAKFAESYIWKRGFLDGYLGFIISVSAAYSVFLKWAKLWELKQNESKG